MFKTLLLLLILCILSFYVITWTYIIYRDYKKRKLKQKIIDAKLKVQLAYRGQPHKALQQALYQAGVVVNLKELEQIKKEFEKTYPGYKKYEEG